MDLLASVLQMLSSMPYVGPVVVWALALMLPVSALISALVLLWQAAVKVLSALAIIPGLSGLAGAAAWLKTEDDAVEGWISGVLKPILDRLSLIPLPSK